MDWLITSEALITTLLMAFGLGLVFSCLVVMGGPVDAPRERGSHHAPTPTSGGLAIMAATGFAVAAGLWLFPDHVSGLPRDALLLFGFAVVMGVSGALDDVYDWPASMRLLLQLSLCLSFGYVFRVETLDFGFGLVLNCGPVFGTLGSALWLLVGINAINFMDGSNGLALGSQLLWLGFAAIIFVLIGPFGAETWPMAGIVTLYIASLGAHAAFLPFNLKGKAFQGDAGSLFSGALITGSILLMQTHKVSTPWLGGYMLAPFLVDVILTMLVRAKHKKPLMSPHKEHLYQLWLQHRDPDHFRLALKMWGLIFVSLSLGLITRLVSEYYHTSYRFIILALWLSLLSWGWLKVRSKLLAP
jgi:UDP-N-acetylmuramyl pentapeptide phosphotransferase/UDP-N-acetylglucosamine-1-phosphate transferase